MTRTTQTEPTIVVAEQVLAELRARAHAALPAETVALLGGTGHAITDLVPLPNVAARGHDRFAVDPVDFVRAVHDLAARGAEFLGFAHSHPGGSAGLSEVDRAELWRGCLQLVLGVAPGGGAIACYRLDDRGAHRLALATA